MVGQARMEEFVAKATTIDGRKECGTFNSVRRMLRRRSKHRRCHTNMPPASQAGAHACRVGLELPHLVGMFVNGRK